MKRAAYFFLIFAMVLSFSGFAMAEDVTIVGTGSGMVLLKSIGYAFTKNNPGINIIVPDSIGSSGGIKAVGTDKYRIGRVSREIKDTEKQYGLTYVPVAKLPVVVVVNKNVKTKDITPQQLCDVYGGKITNWKDMGGDDETIRVIRREDGDSSLVVLQELLPGFKNIKITEKSKTTFTDQETLSLTEQKSGTIAFGTYENALDYKVNVLTINGKKPTDHDYPYYSVLALVFKEQNNAGNIRKFVEFAKSPDIRDIIVQAGGLPISARP